ncbi:TonB-dependent receptor [Phenylobacterium sp. VNQ135]|uniref:TonB-dependent receptor n=1 Tax=Phenylobacterium sp. VNQ135 TaxID=3400922 RepID=UPI003BFD5C26
MKSSTIRGRLLASTLYAGAAALGLVATAALPGVAVAQDYTSGNLSGRVETAEGAPVAGATVTVRSGQGVSRQATTDANGRYQINALPVGPYSAEISGAAGSLADQRVSVQPGGSSFNFTLGGGTVDELVVTGARATRDFARTDTGQVFDVPQLAVQVPVNRSIANVALLTPGVSRPDATIDASSRRNQSTLVVGGTSAAESVYYINGLNVTDLRNLLGYADLPFDAIQSIDVKTGGYQAEFGRATGGVVNIVTKSGSNEWHGGITATWSPSSLRNEVPVAHTAGGSGVSGALVYNDLYKLDQIDTSVYLSGPILKDRLFFFGLYNVRRTKEDFAMSSQGLTGTTQYTGVQNITRSDSPRWLTKFDLNITDRQRLEATIFSDENSTEQRFLSRDMRVGVTGEGLGYDEKAGGLNQIYKYTGAFTDWFTLSALYGEVKSDQQDEGELVGIPRVADRRGSSVVFLTPATTLASLQPVGEDTRKTYRIDADFYANFFGSHHIRVGYDREELHSSDVHAYNGGYYMDIFHGSPDGVLPDQDYASVTYFGSGGEYDAEQTAFYLQDSWDVTDTLTVQAGVRLDQYDYKNRDGQSYIKLDDQYAPRLGFTWDPRGEGRDKVYGSFGRYYLPIATNTSIREVSGEDYHQEFRALTLNPDGSLRRDASGVPILGARIVPDAIYARPISPAPAEATASNIKPMYEDEFVLGYEHEFADGYLDGWRAGVRYVNRDLKSTIEDTDLGRGGVIDRYCARTHAAGCNVITYDSEGNPLTANDRFTGAYILFNPGSRADLMLDLGAGPGGGALAAVNLTAEDLQLTKAKRKYQALEFTFERPFDGRWMLQGSYVLAKSKGNYEGAVKSDVGQIDTSITQDFDAWFQQEGSYGYLPNDRRHTLKLFGSYQVTEQLRVGANFYAQSGRPYGCLAYHPEDPSAGATPSAWYCLRNGTRTLTPRGSLGRTGWVTNTDLNISYDIVPQKDGFGAVTAAVDVFNVFNEQTVTRVVEQSETTNRIGRPITVVGKARSYQSPRSVRFTLRYAF